MKQTVIQRIKNTKQMLLGTGLFFAFLFVPHVLLLQVDSYRPKLRIETEIYSEFYLGLLFAILAIVVFQGAMIASRIELATIKRHILSLESKGWFRLLIAGLTVMMFLLLAAGIGVKQSSSPFNFIIRLFPREFVIITATAAAISTKKPFWILLLVINIAYWVLIGSKAALFTVALSALFLHILEGERIRRTHVAWALAFLIFVPISFFIIAGLRLGIGPLELMGLAFDSPEARIGMMNSLFVRVSWFDGMQLTTYQAMPLAHFGVVDFLKGGILRILPGIDVQELPFGQQIIYLFRASDLDEFSGAIGLPGVLKVFFYNHGVFGVAALLGVLFALFYGFGRLAQSHKPMVALVGFSVFVMGTSSIMISGNFDSALSNIATLLLAGLTIAFVMRLLFRSAAMRPVPA